MQELPFITLDEFAAACGDLEPLLRSCGVDCRCVNEDPTKSLLILRRSVRDHVPDLDRSHDSKPKPKPKLKLKPGPEPEPTTASISESATGTPAPTSAKSAASAAAAAAAAVVYTKDTQQGAPTKAETDTVDLTQQLNTTTITTTIKETDRLEPAEEKEAEEDHLEEETLELESMEEADDPACLEMPEFNPWTVPIEFHILLSPTYRVPVLYFQIPYPLTTTGRPSVDEVLERLVPAAVRPQVEAVGVMGAISMTHHPVNGLTFYMIHPCNTAEALREILKESSPSPVQYLLKWLGLVGPTVGLYVPKEIMSKGFLMT